MIGEGPQNFRVDNNVAVKPDNANVALAALPPSDIDTITISKTKPRKTTTSLSQNNLVI